MLEDEIRFYYGAYSQGATGSDDVKLTTGIGLATLPRDRFAGLQPVPRSDQPTLKNPLEKMGQVTLKPLDLTGVKSLELNADAAGGEVRVEILDGEGRRVRGFSREDAMVRYRRFPAPFPPLAVAQHHEPAAGQLHAAAPFA